ncbi:hypothetical protein DEAC_c31580 [Desulfosporosinus acididurans]|uniref:Uncharacterized protein n=1 Tax=Desulfosporosinus acididurans TaxID=476652 RepID=A0A0J1FMX5_9FIRM|nr:hypothetical protein [Desulfosporosinus acididurans]KLU64830.1 hypothetical protein DEAC_c31580 [Desulfosporosinus acididurans]
MDQELILKNNYPAQYNLFGIYVDWQIDNNYIGFLAQIPMELTTSASFQNSEGKQKQAHWSGSIEKTREARKEIQAACI